jgi:hypothetical protein
MVASYSRGVAAQLVECDIRLAKVLNSALLFLGHFRAIVLLGEAVESGLDLRSRYTFQRARAHLLDGFVEQGGIATEGLGKIQLVAVVGILLAAFALTCRWRRHANG